MICLNKNNPEIQSMLKASGLSELELGALINTWMELNPGEDFPTLEDLGISVVTDSALSNKDPFIGIVLANYNVSISNNRYKYNGNSYNEDQILSKLLGISVSKNNVVKFDAKKFFEANPLVLQDIQEATGMSKSSIINKYQNHVTSSENIISTLFDVDRFVNSIETNYIEDAIIEEDNSANKYIKPEVEDLFESNPELANTVYEALGFNIINEAEITYTDEDGKHCAKIGLTNTTKGTGWKIVKDFKGKPKHSQGGYDITIKDNGFYVNDIKAKNGLLLINKNI